ncbi:MAG: thiolase C-terminal domain-containing protein [Candidatus Binatia bacterium]
MNDRAAIVGIGALPYSKDIGRPIGDTAVEAVLRAIADAGLRPSDVDGTVKFTAEETQECAIARRAGIENLRFFCETSYGGGPNCATVGHAAAAIALGLASVVVCWRARNRAAKTSRPWSQEKGIIREDKQWHLPWGLIRPVDVVGMWGRHHMARYGTTREQLAEVAIAFRRHAERNPGAMMRRPLTLDEYLASRMVSDPLCLYDCSLETDGAVACVVTSAERARDLPHPPAYVHAYAQGTGPNQVHLANYNTLDFATTARFCAQELWKRSDLGPRDVQCVQIYDAFTPLVLLGLEEYGFCGEGESGRFVEGGTLGPGGRLPANTSGGSLSEAYVHGFNLVVEAVRQIRGTATSQVAGCKAVLVTGAAAVSTSAVVLRGN